MAQGMAVLVKCLIFVFNLLFCVTGLALIAIGSLVEYKARNYLNLLGDSYISSATLLIILGIVIFFTSFLGCCGACKENVCMMLTFSVLLFLLFVAEMAAAISAYVYRNELKGILHDGLSNNFDKALNEKADAIKGWEHIQHDFNCCGFNGPDDFNSTNVIPFLTCCKLLSVDVNCTREFAQPEGCKVAVVNFFTSNIGAIGGAALAVAFIEVFGIMLACCLARAM